MIAFPVSSPVHMQRFPQQENPHLTNIHTTIVSATTCHRVPTAGQHYSATKPATSAFGQTASGWSAPVTLRRSGGGMKCCDSSKAGNQGTMTPPCPRVPICTLIWHRARHPAGPPSRPQPAPDRAVDDTAGSQGAHGPAGTGSISDSKIKTPAAARLLPTAGMNRVRHRRSPPQHPRRPRVRPAVPAALLIRTPGFPLIAARCGDGRTTSCQCAYRQLDLVG